MAVTMMDWALFYQSQKLSIIPVQGKIPLIKWKEYQERHASEEEIKEWWKIYPEADIGCVTGAISNKLVLDIDGAEGLKKVSELDCLATQIVKTARGQQYHYKWVSSYSFKTTLVGVLPEIDTRGNGGYVKLPPSKFSNGSGRYTWITKLNTPLAEAPQWLIELMISKQHDKLIIKEANEGWLQGIFDNLKEGNRNESFTRIAGSLRSRGYSSSDIYIFLTDKAESINFDLSELRTICESVGQYNPRTHLTLQDAQSIDVFLQDEQKVNWLVPGLIAKRSIGFMAGLPETNKTWTMIDLAVEVARGGGQWLGKFQTNGGKVLFIDQERWKGETQRRLKNVVSAKALNVTTLKQSLHIKCGTTIRLNLPHSYDAFRKELLELMPDLVIVDSFATFHTISENDRMEIQKVLEVVKSLRNEIGCTFLFINHESKMVLNRDKDDIRQPSASDMMGSIGVPAAAEVVFTVRRKDADSCMVYQTKNTLGQKIEPFQVSVQDVANGIQVRGN